MMLKIAILILFIAVVVSLTSALGFLFRDQHAPESKRTLWALGIRITLAGMLMLLVFYGLSSGELTLNAPWHEARHPQSK